MSFGASLLILVGVTTVAKLMVGPIDEIAPFLGMWLGCVLVPLGALALRLHRGVVVPSPWADAVDRRRSLWTVAIPLFVVVLLFPKLFFENFNEDGIEAFEFGRSL